jgi:chemotaxis protein CheC
VTNYRPPLPQEELDRLRELSTLGASLASTALGALIELPVQPGPTRLCRPTEPTRTDCWSSGIVFEVEGEMSGVVVIVLPEDRCNFAVERMLGRADAPTEVVDSALREFGNIIASHTVSAMADALDATILISVPTLAVRDAGVVLGALIAERSASVRIETDLLGPHGETEALLVFVPEPLKPRPL